MSVIIIGGSPTRISNKYLPFRRHNGNALAQSIKQRICTAARKECLFLQADV